MIGSVSGFSIIVERYSQVVLALGAVLWAVSALFGPSAKRKAFSQGLLPKTIWNLTLAYIAMTLWAVFLYVAVYLEIKKDWWFSALGAILWLTSVLFAYRAGVLIREVLRKK